MKILYEIPRKMLVEIKKKLSVNPQKFFINV